MTNTTKRPRKSPATAPIGQSAASPVSVSVETENADDVRDGQMVVPEPSGDSLSPTSPETSDSSASTAAGSVASSTERPVNSDSTGKSFRALTTDDAYFLGEGTHARLYETLGSHPSPSGEGIRFALWAPNASYVAVIGEWNGWNAGADPLIASQDTTGVWFTDVPSARVGQTYKYRVVGPWGHYTVDKADPMAQRTELPPATASRISEPGHSWQDSEWMATRGAKNALDAPISIYEMHIGSWRRNDGQPLTYRELAPQLADYIDQMGFTHVELMPITEHPFYGSWGYQATGFFAPTARYGTPDDFAYLVDQLHQRGIGVILDWVPSHFPTDEFALQYFDGTHLYEHADPRQGFHPEWNSSIFNYGRGEVSSFLISSALYWLDRFHLDGIRVDAVASMLYLNYARKDGEWIPNKNGGQENLEAIAFLRRLNEAVYREHPDVMTIAEESTAWPMVSRPTTMGGLGFGMKWNMGWMHDTLAFLQKDPIYRGYDLGSMTFSLVYAFNENFVLPLSHDEVVYGKGSLLGKMPGDAWQQFANLRILFAFMWAHPGKKLLFMGGEFGQGKEWTHEGQLDWWQLEDSRHRGVQRLVEDLNRLLKREPALHQLDFSSEGFEWVEGHDVERSVIAFLRKPADGGAPLLVICNFTPVPREGYRIGVPTAGRWSEVLNTDAGDYGGSGWGNWGGVYSEPESAQGREQSLRVTLPALSVVIFRYDNNG